MNFRTRPHFEDRQVVQYVGESVNLSGSTFYANTGGVTIEPTILDFTGGTSGQTTVTINGLTGYLNDNNRLSGLIINPPELKLSGTTGTTSVNVENFVLRAIDSSGTVGWSPISGASFSASACTSPFLTTDIQPCTPGGTITVNAGALDINSTLTINDGTQSDGYVFVSNGSGVGSWQPNYVFTGNTSGGCITDIYVSNIHSCSPLNINPYNEGNVYFGSTSGFTVDLDNGGNTYTKGRHVLHSDSVLDVTSLPSTLEDEIKGSFTGFDWTGLTTNILNNSNTNGYTSFLLGNLSSYPSNNKYGFLSYYNSTYVRSGSPTTGTNFYQDKLVLKSANNSDGIVFSNDKANPFWWENNSGSQMILSSVGNLGIGLNTNGTELPSERLHVRGDTLIEDTDGRFYTDLQGSGGPIVVLSGSTTSLTRFGVLSPTFGVVTFGVRGESEPSFPGYGKNGDSYLYSSSANNGLNIISSDGSGTEDYIRFYAGQDADGTTPDLHIQGTGTTRGNVGINTDSPTEKLHVSGSVRIVDGNEQDDYILTSDADGVASWQSKPHYINYFEFAGSPVTTVVSSGTWYKLNTTGTTSLFSRGELVHTNNKVTYTGTTAKVFEIEGIIAISSGNNQEIHASFFKNNSLYPCSEQSTITSSGGKSTAFPFHCVVELQTNEYVEVFVKNQTSTDNITLNNVNVIVKEL